MKKILLILLLPLLLGCASGYRTLRPTSDYYPSSRNYSGLQMSYKMGVLRERHNKKYAKREDKTAIRVVAVKLVNNTDRDLVVGKDFKFYSGESELPLMDPAVVHEQLKQGVPIYLLYLLLSPLQLYRYDETGVATSSTPIGLFLGPGIAIGNMLGAGSANQNFLRELIRFNIINKTIESGQTVHGLIGIRDNGYNPIEIRYVD